MTVLNSDSEISEGLTPFASLEEVAALGRNELVCVAIPGYNGVTAVVAQELEAILIPLGRRNRSRVRSDSWSSKWAVACAACIG